MQVSPVVFPLILVAPSKNPDIPLPVSCYHLVVLDKCPCLCYNDAAAVSTTFKENDPFMNHFTCRTILASTALLGTALLAGCGGSSGTSGTSSARVRVFDAATNAGTANILVNGGSGYGNQVFLGTSPYLYLATGASTFTYTSTLLPTGAVSTPTTYTLNDGVFYTAYLIGRADVPATDGRYLQVVVANDANTPASGQAGVSVLNAAPDAGSVDVSVNNTPFPGVAYPTAAKQATAYQSVAAGAVSVTVKAAGTSTVLVPATPLTVAAGQSYTLLVTEPTTAPTYAVTLVPNTQK